MAVWLFRYSFPRRGNQLDAKTPEWRRASLDHDGFAEGTSNDDPLSAVHEPVAALEGEHRSDVRGVVDAGWFIEIGIGEAVEGF